MFRCDSCLDTGLRRIRFGADYCESRDCVECECQGKHLDYMFHGPPVTIVCLCGSTRFMDAFQKAKFDETLAGRIVLSIGCDTKSDGDLFKGPEGDAIKIRLDELHKRKIDLADEVLILNVGGYIGSSTKSELEYAQKYGKRIRYLESV